MFFDHGADPGQSEFVAEGYACCCPSHSGTKSTSQMCLIILFVYKINARAVWPLEYERRREVSRIRLAAYC